MLDADFAADASKKHSDYTKERNHLLEQCKVLYYSYYNVELLLL